MSSDVSATDLSVDSDLSEAKNPVADQVSVEVAVDSAPGPKRVPVEVVFADEADADDVISNKADQANKPDQASVVVEPASVEVAEPAKSEDATNADTKPAVERKPETEKPQVEAQAKAESQPNPKSELVAEKNEPKVAEASTVNPFAAMGLSTQVLSAISKAGYDSPSPIQSETVPQILQGRDMMGQAATGSGKTAAFAWPILSNLDPKQKSPQVLVLAPTRELAIQVTRAFEKYASGIKGFRAVTIYGGASYETQNRALSRGVHVVVGTPGRVMDHLRRGTLNLDGIKTFILDEADEMLRMGFIDDVEWIMDQMPGQRQILTFSATLPPPVQRIAEKYLDNPVNVSIKSNSATADSIAQSCVFLHAREKRARLVRLLATEETEGVIVFVKTRNTTMVVTEHLIQKGIIASALNGDIPQNQRERTVSQLKSGRINVVVATDVAARGLDVERISHVINYDFPHDTEAYVHRIGRTGRAGRSGNAILFVEPKEKGKLSRLQRATNQKIETFKEKSIDEINALRVSAFKQKIVEASTNKQIKFFTDMVSELQTESGLTPETIASALAVMAQGDTPLLLKEFAQHQSNWKKNKAGGERGPMQTYRIEVGRSHKVAPGNIVGAITNEAGIDNSMIGRINIFDDFSTIDLPTDLPQDIVEHLAGIYVCGQQLAIAKDDRQYQKTDSRRSGGRGGPRSRSGGGGRYEKKSYGKKPWEKRSGDKKPYEKKAFGKSGKPKNKSNAEGSRSGYSKLDNAEFKSERYSKGGKSGGYKSGGYKKKASTTPKTKAAQRTKANRKPGAKLSSPVKKYVKIRSAK